MKVILHVDEIERFKIAIGNVKNILKLEPDMVIEVLVHNEPLKYLEKENDFKENFREDLINLSSKGVQFAACNNTMTKMGILKEDLYPFVKVVRAGVLELIEKEGEGYAYVKP